MSAHPNRTVAFACLAMLVSYLPFSAVNGALGAVAATTGAGTGRLQWVSDAFAVALAAAVLPAGVLADRLGRRAVTLAGLAGTALGAAIGWAAGAAGGPSAIVALWVAQGVAGLGAGAVMSASLGLLAATAPDAPRRARWISLWAAATVGGLGLGPFLAGAVGRWWWLYPPIALLAAVAAALGSGVAESRAPRRGPADPAGQAAVAVAVAALVSGVIEGGTAGWTAPATLAAFGVAALAVVALAAIERRAAAPLLPLSLFASRGFAAAGLAATVVLFAVGGGLFFLSLALSRQHVGQLGIALRLACLFAGNATAAVVAGRLQRRWPSRAILLGGLVVAATGAALLLTLPGGDPAAGRLSALGWRLAILGAGAGLVMSTSSTVAVQSVPGAFAGLAGAANNAVRQIGAALGPAVLGGLLAGEPADAVRACATALTAALSLTALISFPLLMTRRTTA
ncbi:MFS transporter [Dactylosporangium sp. CA-092794]|uniref:MFS transporter n=1 Tax=Dactylosporangium sp. CA-092794 TaxID=3239929 RepID=UPI003D929604